MRLAYLILAHKSPALVNAFMRQIAGDGRADVYLHVDAKTPAAVFERFDRGGNVVRLDDRRAVSWGDFDTVEATLHGFRAILASGKDYDFVSLNSGQDLLVRNGLEAALASAPGRIHMDWKRHGPGDPRNYFWDVRWPAWARDNSVATRAARSAARLLYARGLNVRPNPRRLPAGWDYHRGSQWFCLSGEALRFVLDFAGREPGYADFWRESLVPDMGYFHTLIGNSPLAAKATGANLTFLEWGDTWRTSNNPKIVSPAMREAVAASGKHFARKFDPSAGVSEIRHYLSAAGTAGGPNFE